MVNLPMLDEFISLQQAQPKSLLTQPPHDLSSRWSKLRRGVEDGRYGIDNDVQENTTRPCYLRNKPFADGLAGAHASANLYSPLQTCRVNGVDGYAAPWPWRTALRDPRS